MDLIGTEDQMMDASDLTNELVSDLLISAIDKIMDN
jgi:hypothetical protein